MARRTNNEDHIAMKQVESMAWTREKPWQGNGTEVKQGATVAAMMKAAKLDWKVEKKPLHILDPKGKSIEVKDKFCLVRDTDSFPLSLCGSVYKPIQNDESLDFMNKFVKAGKMHMETVGSLWHGRVVWGLARIDKDFSVGRDDPVSSYLLMLSPHVQGRAMVIQYMNMRERCWNTLSMMLGAGLGKNSDKGNVFRLPHTRVFGEDVKEEAAVALRLAVKQADEHKTVMQKMAKVKLTDEEATEFFCEVLHFDPDAPKTVKKDGEPRLPLLLNKFEDAALHAPGADVSQARGTLWGAFNAVTSTVDHNRGKDRSLALRGAWLGHGARLKRRALNAAIQRMK